MGLAGAVGHEIAHVASVVPTDGVVRRDERMLMGARGVKMSAAAHCLDRIAYVAEFVDVEAMLAGGQSGYICHNFHSAFGRGKRDDPGGLIAGGMLNDSDGGGHGGGIGGGQTLGTAKQKERAEDDGDGESRKNSHGGESWLRFPLVANESDDDSVGCLPNGPGVAACSCLFKFPLQGCGKGYPPANHRDQRQCF